MRIRTFKPGLNAQYDSFVIFQYLHIGLEENPFKTSRSGGRGHLRGFPTFSPPATLKLPAGELCEGAHSQYA